MFEHRYKSMRAEAREAIIDYLTNNSGFYLCDMHNEIFNSEFYTTNRKQAIETIADGDIYQSWKTVNEIIKYEKSEFGEVNTNFSDPCEVCNMLYYIIGEQEIFKMFDDCDLYNNLYGEKVTEEDCKSLVKWVYDHGRNLNRRRQK